MACRATHVHQYGTSKRYSTSGKISEPLLLEVTTYKMYYINQKKNYSPAQLLACCLNLSTCGIGVQFINILYKFLNHTLFHYLECSNKMFSVTSVFKGGTTYTLTVKVI
jgi:hypothetical protein